MTVEPTTDTVPPRYAAAMRECLRIVAKVAARDFSEKPPLVEGDDALSQFLIGFRFMIEDLERSLRAEESERDALRGANERLEELDEMKTRLINSCAHELGTPLTPIKLQLHMMRLVGPSDPARYAKSLGILERNVGRLEFLVSDMLDVARLQSGGFQLARVRADMSRIVRQSVESFEASARAASLTLQTEASGPLWVDADAKRLAQVLDNVIGNAIKFTPRGGTVRVRAVADARHVRIEVRDTGVGIGANDLPKLFRPFSQIEDPMQKTRAGTGLGLYICRGIVEQHGGHIWVESPGPNRGSTFYLEVPAASKQVLAEGDPVPAPSAASGPLSSA